MELLSIEQLKEFLNSNEFEFKPIQSKLCFPIIKRIYHKMKLGIPFENINVKDGLLVNGHHRYICSLLLKKEIGINPWQYSLKETNLKWSQIEIDQTDWDTKDMIDRHNSKDAAISGLNINLFEL
jgi:hypothetical protein